MTDERAKSGLYDQDHIDALIEDNEIRRMMVVFYALQDIRAGKAEPDSNNDNPLFSTQMYPYGEDGSGYTGGSGYPRNVKPK